MAEMMATTTTHSIPLLTDDNYPQWLIDIKAVLRRQKLWDCTQSRKPKVEGEAKVEEEERGRRRR
jgi:hypothetical protein